MKNIARWNFWTRFFPIRVIVRYFCARLQVGERPIYQRGFVSTELLISFVILFVRNNFSIFGDDRHQEKCQGTAWTLVTSQNTVFTGEGQWITLRLKHGELFGCVLVYRYTKERNINELRHNSMYGYENNRNSPVYRYTRTAPTFLTNHNRSSGRRYGRRVLEGIGQSIFVQKREGEL